MFHCPSIINYTCTHGATTPGNFEVSITDYHVSHIFFMHDNLLFFLPWNAMLGVRVWWEIYISFHSYKWWPKQTISSM